MLNEVFARRFTELARKFSTLPFKPSGAGGAHTYVPQANWQQWGTSVQSLIHAVYGEGSPHYENYVAAFKACNGDDYAVFTLQGLFLAAKDDFEGGYVFNVDLRVSPLCQYDLLHLPLNN